MMSANVAFINDGAVQLQNIFRNRFSAADCGSQKTGSLHRKIDTPPAVPSQSGTSNA